MGIPTTELEVLNYVFRENSSLDKKEKENNISTYYAIKHHIPKEVFATGQLKFNYNNAISYILVSYADTTLFKIPNHKKEEITFICPPDKNFIQSLDISDTKKDLFIKKYKNSKRNFWYVNLSAEEVLCFSSTHWESFKKLLISLIKK